MGMKTPFPKSLEQKYLVIITIFLCACSGLTDEKHIYIDPAFQKYVSEFHQYAYQRGLDFHDQDIVMTHKKLEGVCGLSNSDKRTVFIDTTSVCWDSDSDKRELIYHELGHYFLHRQHDTTIINGHGNIKSIMYPGGFIVFFEEYKEYYVNELFDPSTKSPF